MALSGCYLLGFQGKDRGDRIGGGARHGIERERFLRVPQIIWGLNNQKIALARAALTARYLNRSLLMPTLSASLSHNSSSPAQTIPFDAVFSLDSFNSRCSGFVRIAREADVPDGAPAVEVIKGSGRRWTAARDLEHLEECRRQDHEVLEILGKNPFLWPDHWAVREYVTIFQCLELTSSIISDVEYVASRLELASSSRNPSYVAVHMRIERDWMIHCRNTEKRALEKEGKKLSICSSKEEIIDRVRRIESLKRPALVYLAVADVLLEEGESSLLRGWGEDLVPVEKKKLGVLDRYARHPYLIQAAIDYEICRRATVFVGNSFSTFSSLVVLQRTLDAPHSCESSFAYNLVTDKGSARPWLADLSKASLSEISYESLEVSCAVTPAP
ncbi:protein-O-fucosyltransferase-like protein [Selaginella moellendorffii]|uniref:O-fucosyltransferase family protein n=2 Tax=Selaginella moellendorffii TaxID=88036 RepID=D8T297_SELML|nr:protein-O-fucosyltransferase-like protein [Selaginella moellendorffii]